MGAEKRFVEYFVTWRAKGYSEEQIKSHLLKLGYPAKVVEEAMVESRVQRPVNASGSVSVSSLVSSSSNSPVKLVKKKNLFMKFIPVMLGIIFLFIVFFVVISVHRGDTGIFSHFGIFNLNKNNEVNKSEKVSDRANLSDNLSNLPHENSSSNGGDSSKGGNSNNENNLGILNQTNLTNTSAGSGGGSGGGGSSGGGSGGSGSTPTCSDGLMNGAETGVDCGGTCSACVSCSDSIKNGGETDIDCGGSCEACSTFARTFYVSNLGNDSNNGTTRASPWRTIAKVNSYTLKAGDGILFRRGDTWHEALNISSSGNASAPITFGAYSTGVRPVISGFTTLSSWSAVSGLSGVYQSSCPSCNSSLNMVAMDGAEQAMGRWPDTGYLTYESHANNTFNHFWSITDNELNGSPNWTGAEVVIRKNHWIIDRNMINLHSGSTINYSSVSDYTGIDGFGYFIQDNPGTLNLLGEWYFNSTSNNLLVYFGGENPASHTVQAGNISRLVSVLEKDYITFNGLSMVGSNEAAFYLYNAKHITIKNCTIDLSGTDGIRGPYWGESNNLDVENTIFNNSNNNAIYLSGDFSYAIIRNTTIQNTGMIPGMGGDGDGKYCALDAGGPNSTLEFNTIDNTGYVPLTFAGDNVLVRNNYITNFCLVKDDGGGIYTYRDSLSDPVYVNRTVANNIVLNGTGAAYGTTSGTGAASGIYIDGVSTNVDIINNTVANCDYGGIFVNSDVGGNVTNNILYNNRNQLALNVYSLYGVGNRPHQNMSFRNNTFFSANTYQFSVSYSNAYNDTIDPTISATNNYYLRPLDDKYVFYTDLASGMRGFTLSSWQGTFGIDMNSNKSPVIIAPYKINGYLSANKFTNQNFTSNVNGISCWNNAGSCVLSWNSSAIDNGSLQVSFSGGQSTTDTHISFSVGVVSSGKDYILKFSHKGSTDINRTIALFLMKSGAPYTILTPIQFVPITTSRGDYEILFSSPLNETTASMFFYFIQNDSTMWFDNIEFYEANITHTNPDDYFLFYYNPSLTDKVFALTGNYTDVANKSYSGNITLKPFTSIVLIKNNFSSSGNSSNASNLSAGTTYYVSNSGNDSNNGLNQSTPWKTLNYAEAHATTPGSIIALKKGDIWSSSTPLQINVSGVAGNNIVWDGSLWGTGANAIIRANQSTGSDYALVHIFNSRYITLQNITVDGYNYSRVYGIVIGGAEDNHYSPNAHENNESNIIVQDSTIMNCGDGTAYAICVLVRTWNNSVISNITIQRNNIFGASSHAISFYPGQSEYGINPGFIKDSYVGYNNISNVHKYTGNVGYGIHMNNKNRNIIIEHNNVTANIGECPVAGIALDRGENASGDYCSQNITIRYNYIKLLEPTCEANGIYIQNAYANQSSNISAYIYGNLIYNADASESPGGGIRIERNTGAYLNGSKFYIYYNTIVTEGGIGIRDNTNDNNTVTLKNNLLINNYVGGGRLLNMYNNGTMIHSNNSYYKTNGGTFVRINNSFDYNSAQTAVWEPSAILTDPLLVNSAGFDYHLQYGSPVIGKGVAISGITVDYDGNTYNVTNPSIGAFEYAGIIPMGNLTVNYTSGGIAVGNATNFAVPANKSINASPSAGYQFVNWSKIVGNCTIINSTNNVTNVTVYNGTCYVQANFNLTGGQHTYYVSNAGNDSSDGLSNNTPWKTISKVNSKTFSSGDQILFKRGDVWRETLTVPSAGNSSNYLNFSNYGTGALPKILGSNVSTGWTNVATNVWKSNTSLNNPYGTSGSEMEIFFEKLDGSRAWGKNKAWSADYSTLTAEYEWTWNNNYIYLYSSSNPGSAYSSVEISQRMYIINLNANQYVAIDGFNLSYGLIGVYGGEYPNTGRNNSIIRNCEIAYLGSKWLGDNNPGYGTMVVYNNMLIEHNVIHDTGRRGAAINNYGNKNISNITVQYNTFYNGYHTTGADVSAGSGTYSGNFYNVTIRNNLMYDAKDRNTSDGAWSELNWVQGPHGGTGKVFGYYFYNNILMYTNMHAIALENVSESYIYNNVFYGQNTNATSNSVHVGYSNQCQNAVLKNNIFYTDLPFDDNTCGAAIGAGMDNQDYAQIDADHNLYYRINNNLRIIDRQGSSYKVYYMSDIRADGFGKLQNDTGWELHSPVPANPLFVDASNNNFSLQAGSPAIHAGVHVSWITTDRDGNAYNNPPSIGAYEYS